MINDLLPIGSVVGINGVEKRLMIYGIKQKNSEDDEEYDYIGVFYPEGNLGPEFQFLFNQSNINEVYFRGYDSEERDYFLNELRKVYEPDSALDIPPGPLEEELSNLEKDPGILFE